MKALEHWQLASLQGLMMCVEAFDTFLDELSVIQDETVRGTEADDVMTEVKEMAKGIRKAYKRELKRREKRLG